ncbi:MAG TPA: Calx-beta domain-containing protein [Gammaproteobacteria bacterium]|nr:Calx-beta domain-containing protein [Gammaproteobacteria bacterium]
MLTESSGLPEAPGQALGPGVEVGGRYLLEDQLEYGRVGTVYKALDKQRTDVWGDPQHVALLAVPQPSVGNAALLEAFKRTFAAVRLLRHPHVVTVLDFDRAGETYFLTMEHVDGASLRSVIESLLPETIARTEAWNVIAAVGAALLYAHDSGVVHGDVRAENVVVAPRGQVKLLFSAACFAASAPFQVDEREDVYGLAELAYELLAGHKPPFDSLRRSRRAGAGRIDGLSRRQWKALQAGLAGREERTRTIAQLLDGLEVSRRSLVRKHAAPSPRRSARERARKRARVARPEPVLERQPLSGDYLPFPPLDEGRDRLTRGGGLVRRAGAAVLIMATVLVAAAVFLRYGPVGIGRGAATVSGAAIEGIGRYVVDPGYRALSALGRLAPPPAAPTQEAAGAASPAGRTEEQTEPATAASADAPGAEADRAQRERNEAAPDAADSSGAARGDSSSAARGDSSSAARGDSSSAGRADSSSAGSAASSSAAQAGSSAQRRDPSAERDATAERSETRAADTETRSADTRSTTPDAEDSAAQGGAPSSASVDAGPAPLSGRTVQGDEGRGGPAFAKREIVVREGQTVVPIEIRRDDTSREARIVWWTQNETAIAGDDYASLGNVVETFAAGEASRTIFVPITNDSVAEGRESFLVHIALASADGRRLGPTQTARVTIVDDDF